jgi:hypothetical protein
VTMPEEPLDACLLLCLKVGDVMEAIPKADRSSTPFGQLPPLRKDSGKVEQWEAVLAKIAPPNVCLLPALFLIQRGKRGIASAGGPRNA